MKVLVTQLCPTLCNPVDCRPPGSSVHGASQVRILEWVAISFSRASSWPRDQTQISCIAGRLFTTWANQGSPIISTLMLLLIWQQVLACSPEVGDPWTRRSVELLTRVPWFFPVWSPHVIWTFYSMVTGFWGSIWKCKGRSWQFLQDWPRKFYILTSFHIFLGENWSQFQPDSRGGDRETTSWSVSGTITSQKSYGMLKLSCKCNCKEDLAHNVCFAILRTGVCLCSANSPWAPDARSEGTVCPRLCKCVCRLCKHIHLPGLPVSRLVSLHSTFYTAVTMTDVLMQHGQLNISPDLKLISDSPWT